MSHHFQSLCYHSQSLSDALAFYRVVKVDSNQAEVLHYPTVKQQQKSNWLGEPLLSLGDKPFAERGGGPTIFSTPLK